MLSRCSCALQEHLHFIVLLMTHSTLDDGEILWCCQGQLGQRWIEYHNTLMKTIKNLMRSTYRFITSQPDTLAVCQLLSHLCLPLFLLRTFRRNIWDKVDMYIHGIWHNVTGRKHKSNLSGILRRDTKQRDTIKCGLLCFCWFYRPNIWTKAQTWAVIFNRVALRRC